MKLGDIWQILKKTSTAFWEDNTFRLGAALAYYTVFSLAPILLIALGVASLVFGQEAARGQIVKEVSGTIGPDAAKAIEGMINNLNETDSGLWATLVSIVLLVIGATGVFVELQDGLNTIWGVKQKPGAGLWGVIKTRLLSFAVVLGIGFLLLVSLVLSAVLSGVGEFLSESALPGGVALWQVINFIVSCIVVTLMFALIYKLLPDVKIAWRDVWVGALFTALLFTAGKQLIGLYLGQQGVTSTFGAAGSLVVVLLWVFYSSQILFFGAEFTQVYADHLGERLAPADNAMSVTENERCREGMEPEKSHSPVRDNRPAPERSQLG
jgi:membrane protein